MALQEYFQDFREHAFGEHEERAAMLRAFDLCAPDILRRADAFNWSLPELKRALTALVATLDALHHAQFIYRKGRKANVLWAHREVNLFKMGHDPIDLDFESLKAAAAEYLTRPAVQCAYLDWLVLDALVFYEVSLFSHKMLATRFGTKRIEWAFIFGPRSPTVYWTARLAFWLVGAVVLFAVPLYFAFRALAEQNQGPALWLAAIPAVVTISRALGFFGRRRVARENTMLLGKMTAVYQHLGSQTISPRRMRELIDDAAKAGVVFDGAVFALVDRMVAADPTAFVRPS
jgi:hypothetical protein